MVYQTIRLFIEVTSSTCYLYWNFLSYDSCDRAYRILHCTKHFTIL